MAPSLSTDTPVGPSRPVKGSTTADPTGGADDCAVCPEVGAGCAVAPADDVDAAVVPAGGGLLPPLFWQASVIAPIARTAPITLIRRRIRRAEFITEP